MSTPHFTRRGLLGIFGGMTAAMLFPELAHAVQNGAKPAAHSPFAFDTNPVKITPLTKTLSLGEGPGGNMLLLLGKDGPLLVDTGIMPRAKDTFKAVTGAAHHPITTVINTHHHYDHTGGNVEFGKARAHIIAHENTRTRISAPQVVEMFNLNIPAYPEPALPTQTFTEAMTLHLNGETIHLLHVAPAHTDSDVLVHFSQSNILHMGDLFFNGYYPVIDFSSKGWIGGMVTGIEKGLMMADAQTKIIPGHGPVGNKAQLTALRDMLAAVQSKIEPMLKDGKSADDIIAAKPTAEFDAQWGKGFLNPDTFVKVVVLGLQQHNAG